MHLRPLTLDRATRRWPPDLGAILRSLGGVLAIAVLALYVGPAGAATAAAVAAVIAAGTALQDEPRGPGPRVAAVSVAMGLAVVLGGVTSGVPVAFVAVVAVWCWLAGLMWTFSVGAGLLATATATLLVMAPPTEPLDALVTAALAVAGGLTQAVLIMVRPRRRWRTQRAASRSAYRSLAEDARAAGSDTDARVDEGPLRHLRETFTLSDYQSRRRPLAYREWYGRPERIAAAVAAAATRITDHDSRRALLDAAADTLEAVAAHDRVGAERARAAVDAAATAVEEPDKAVAQRLSRSLWDAVEAHFGGIVSTPSDLRRLTRAGVAAAIRARVEAIRGQLDPRSSILRHAIRLGAAAAIGTAVTRWAALPHGYWAALAVLLVLRPESAHTYTRCAGRLAGVLAGIAAASVLTVAWHPTGIPAAAMAVSCLGLTYAISAYGYIAISAGLAATLVFVADISAAGAAGMTDRLSAVLIGGGLAVLGHVLLPDDELVRLRQRAGELLRAEVDYAAAVIRAFVHDQSRPADAVSAAWQRAFRSRAAFEAASGATRLEARDLRLWLRTYRSALNAVTASCTALENNLPAQLPAAMTDDFVTAVDDYVDVLRGGFTDPTSAWTVDADALVAAQARVREVAATLPSSLGAARVLVGEIGVITEQLGRISGDTPR